MSLFGLFIAVFIGSVSSRKWAQVSTRCWQADVAFALVLGKSPASCDALRQPLGDDGRVLSRAKCWSLTERVVRPDGMRQARILTS
jgi:hypothetical protein